MLVQIKKLNVISEGHRRSVTIDKVYLNSNHVVSITDFSGAKDLLLQEGHPEIAKQKFCLLRINSLDKIEEMIVLGSSDDLCVKFNKTAGKRILNG